MTKVFCEPELVKLVLNVQHDPSPCILCGVVRSSEMSCTNFIQMTGNFRCTFLLVLFSKELSLSCCLRAIDSFLDQDSTCNLEESAYVGTLAVVCLALLPHCSAVGESTH